MAGKRNEINFFLRVLSEFRGRARNLSPKSPQSHFEYNNNVIEIRLSGRGQLWLMNNVGRNNISNTQMWLWYFNLLFIVPRQLSRINLCQNRSRNFKPSTFTIPLHVNRIKNPTLKTIKTSYLYLYVYFFEVIIIR